MRGLLTLKKDQSMIDAPNRQRKPLLTSNLVAGSTIGANHCIFTESKNETPPTPSIVIDPARQLQFQYTPTSITYQTFYSARTRISKHALVRTSLVSTTNDLT